MNLGILDLSSIFHRLWHVDKDNVEHRIISFLKTMKEHDVIIAIDSPPYKRKETYPAYKANRDVPDPELIGCLKNVQNRLYKEGFKIAKAEGWEADDVIATIINGMIDKGTYQEENVTVYGSDKDLLQITPLTDFIKLEKHTAASRLGIQEYQVADYLALVGDPSDNIKGVPGVGEKTAVALINTFGQIDDIYKAIDTTPELFTKPKILESLIASRTQVKESLKLILLNCACEIEYIQKEKAEETMEPEQEETEVLQVQGKEQEKTTAVALRTEPVSYKNSLEPINLNQAMKISEVFARAGLYPQFKGPEQIMMVVMRGRELGIGASSALELIDLINGKPAMKAAGMVAIVKSRSDVCEYIYLDKLTEKKATWITKRVGYPKEDSASFTEQEAIDMELIIPDGVVIKDKYGKTKETKDNYKKQPQTMYKWRASSKLIREVYPDLINGLHSVEELIDG